MDNSDGVAKKGKTTKRKKKTGTRTHPHTPDGLNVFHKKFRLSVPQVLDQSEISPQKKQKQKKRATTQGITTFSILCNFAFCAILFPEFL